MPKGNDKWCGEKAAHYRRLQASPRLPPAFCGFLFFGESVPHAWLAPVERAAVESALMRSRIDRHSRAPAGSPCSWRASILLAATPVASVPYWRSISSAQADSSFSVVSDIEGLCRGVPNRARSLRSPSRRCCRRHLQRSVLRSCSAPRAMPSSFSSEASRVLQSAASRSRTGLSRHCLDLSRTPWHPCQ
jgi:hypothetical protein